MESLSDQPDSALDKEAASYVMRTNVTFQHPAEFVPVSENDGILSAGAADWFVSLLRRVDGLLIRGCLCQEDWGVVVFAERAGKRFWVGLSFWPDGESAWLAHFHHHDFAWLQRWSRAGRHELACLIGDFHAVLASEPVIHNIAWYYERDLMRADAPSSATPVAA